MGVIGADEDDADAGVGDENPNGIVSLSTMTFAPDVDVAAAWSNCEYAFHRSSLASVAFCDFDFCDCVNTAAR